MNKVHFKSKKFTAFAVAIVLTVVFTITALVFIMLVPSASASIVNLITVALATMNGAVSMYTIGQSVVDYKIQSNNISNQSDSNTNDVANIKEHLIEEERRYDIQFEGDGTVEDPFI